MYLVISALSFFLLAVSSMGLSGCDRQIPPPKAVKELPAPPETAVGEMALGAIGKAKGAETMLGEAGKRTAETVKEGAP
ncbi:MAG: hypothetical protein RL042_2257 [Nitrospirota bacterium]|jgi:nitroreductase